MALARRDPWKYPTAVATAPAEVGRIRLQATNRLARTEQAEDTHLRLSRFNAVALLATFSFPVLVKTLC
jgi:hypothetical protein